MSQLPIIARTRCLSGEQETILLRLMRGDRLVGPVTIRIPNNGSSTLVPRPWGFAEGGGAHLGAVRALARRGLIAIEERGGCRSAHLTSAVLTEDHA